MRQLEDFDAEYFGYTDAQADLMDPLDRFMITEACQAVMDAGVNPDTLRGTNTGFFFGSFVDEVQTVLKDELDAKESIFQHHASRIHEALDLRGPALWLENGCATSLTAMNSAVAAIQSGLCDQALVGGVNITMDPTKVSWQMLYETLSHDSTCHVFDVKACGYVKGEAAVVVFVQRKSQAKRIHAEILGISSNHDGYKTDGYTHPGWKTQRDLMLGAMKRANINGNDYDYFEAHGTGTQAGDKCELRSIYEAICRDRSRPLTIGSIKSITGHAEGASGLVSLAKIIIAYQSGVLAPNLHYEVPNPKIPALTDGTFFVPTKATPFAGGICGINNFGIGGGNASLVIKSYDDRKASEEDYDIATPLPRLVPICGRNRMTVAETLALIEGGVTRVTRGYLALLNEIANMCPKRGMKTRGYLLLDKCRSIYSKGVEDVLMPETGEKRPICYVFDGLGSHWVGMAKNMTNVNVFINSVYRSIKYLTSLDYDNDVMRQYLLHGQLEDKQNEPMIVGLVIIQIALVESLAQLGIKPDLIVGYSVGEIAAAFADGCITREAALKIAMMAEKELAMLRDLEPGAMVEVKMPLEEARQLPRKYKTIEIVSATTDNTIMVSGCKEDIDHLLSTKVPAKVLPTNQMWMHNVFWKNSYYRVLFKAFRSIPLKPITRSARFLSNYSCPDSSATYFAKSLVEPVDFFEAIKQVPKNTVFVELSPSNRLVEAIANSFESEHGVTCVELMKADNVLNEFVFLNTIGRLYTSGQNIELNQLYPAVQYPVTRNTDFISPIIRFDHSKPRFVTVFPEYFNASTVKRSTYKETVTLAGDYAYFSDHAVDGIVLYPATGYLYLAWKAIAQFHGVKDYLAFPVEFKQINISRATRLTADKETVLKCTYFHDTGSFVVEANNTLCTTGNIVPLKNYQFIEPTKDNIKTKDVLMLDNETFYRELHVRGYHFGKTFQNVVKVNDESTYSMVKWTDNMITYLDGILQSSVMAQELRLLYVPTLIESLKVDTELIKKKLRFDTETKMRVADVYLDHRTKLIHAPGVEVMNASFRPIARKIEEAANCELVLESNELIGYDEGDAIDRDTRAMIEDYLESCKATKEGTIGENEIKSQTCGLYQLCHSKKPIDQKTISTDLDMDRLHATLTSDRFFRTQLDVVIENINLYHKFNVLEINTSQQLVYHKLLKVISRPLFGFAMNNLHYTLAHSNAASLPDDVRQDSFLKMMNFDLPETRLLYRDLCPQEFVIYRDPRISLDQINVRIDYDLLLRSIETALAANGFLLAYLRESVHPLESQHCGGIRPEKFKQEVEKFIKFAEEAGLEYVGKKSDTFSCCSILFRKVEQVVHNEKIIEINNDNLDWLEVLKEANRSEEVTRIWIHSTEPQSGIVGLMRGLAKDIAKNKGKYVYYDPKHITFQKALNVARRTQLLQNAFVGDKLGSYRHITFVDTPDFVNNVKEFELRQIKSGDLSSFRPFVKEPLPALGYDVNAKHDLALGPHDRVEKLLVDIKKSALNFRDVMIASARMDASNVSDHMTWDDVVLGFEFSGILRENGQRVMGFDNCKGLSVNIVANREFLWPVPDHWTLEQAVTVPCVYATCYYGLCIRAKVQRGESILIHAGTGGIGLAAINICLAMGCNIFVTAGTEEKRAYLRKTYPQIKPEQIGNSRNCSFETMVLQATEGRGVDLVLNSLTDDMFWASLRCLADNGRFVEIGKYQFMNNDLMGKFDRWKFKI